LGPRPGNMSQNGPKTTSLMTSLTKNPQPPTKKFFFECRLEDWPIRLSPSSTIGGGPMALVRQLKTASFRPKFRYEVSYASSQSGKNYD